MPTKLQRLPWLFVFAPAVIAAWAATHSFDAVQEWTMAPNLLLLAALVVGYVFLRRLRSPHFEIAWTLVSLSVLVRVLATMTADSAWDAWIEAALAAGGCLTLTVQLFRWQVSEERQRRQSIEEKRIYDANHDNLTDLSNRASFLRSLTARWSEIEPASRSSLAVLFVDIDALRIVNQSYGRVTGDEMLKIFARRLQGALRDRDVVARIGGDEFVALITGLSDNDALHALLARVHHRLTRKANVNGLAILPHASIGVARGSERHAQPRDLLRAAEASMYAAKRRRQASGPLAVA